MVDLMFLGSDENFIIDTQTAITSILLIYGAVEIKNTSDNTVIATLKDDIELFTVPANSGKYTIANINSGSSKVAIVRMFYI
jgi:hypothetical protein